MNRYFMLLLCLSLLYASVFGVAVSADNQIHQVTVRVGTYENRPKVFTDERGNAAGFWPDIIEYIASEEGWEIDYVHGTWIQCLQRLEKNEIDMMPDVAYTEERSRRYDFSNETVHVSWSRVYAREGADIQSILDLEGKNIAVLEGSVNVEGPEGIKKLVRDFDINCTFTEVDSYIKVFELVESGEADAGVTNKDFANQHEADFNIVKTAIIFQPASLYFAFPKESSLTPYLIERIDYHMKELKEDEDSIYYQSLEKWLGVKPIEKVAVPGWMLWALIGIGGLALLLAAGGYILRFQVRARTKELTDDITERRKMEEALRESEERYRLVLENSPIAVAVLDDSFRITYVNDEASKIAGYSRNELIGMNFPDLLDQESVELVKDRYLRRQRGEDIPRQYEFNTIRKDGERRRVETTTAIYKDSSGRTISIAQLKDITEQRKIEEALRESEEKHSAVVENARDGIFIIQDEAFVFVNKAAEKMTGYSEYEVSGRHFLDVIAPESKDLVAKRYKDRITGKKVPSNYEIKVKTKEGTVKDAELSAGIMQYRGRPAVVGILRDITERKKAEEEIIKFRTVTEEAPYGVAMVNLSGEYLFVNEAFAAMHGYTRAEIVKKRFSDIIAREDLRITEQSLRQLIKTGIPITRELRRRKKDGSIFPSLTAAAAVHDEKRNVSYVATTVMDITERKEAEQALRNSEERYRSLFELSPDAIITLDRKGKITSCNTRALELQGYAENEIVGRYFTKLPTLKAKDIPKFLKIFNALFRGKIPEPIEINFTHKDGTPRCVETRIGLLKVGHKRLGIHVVAWDVTERRKAEEERKKMQEQLIISDRLASVGELSAGIAHELNNPLTTVIGFSDLLLQKDVPGDVREDLQMVNREAKRTADIIKNLLTFARKHEAGKAPTSINKIIENVLALRAYEQKVHNIEVKADLAPDLPEITADPFRLQQVFLNIIINAEYFMTQAHGKGTLTINTKQIGDTVRASFADDGPGIPKENLSHLFDPFFTTKEVGVGTGLGLSISHGIIAEHGGRIYAESKAGEGATFIVELPITQ